MPEVREGALAPDVALVDYERQPVRLSALLGQPLVLAFFPAAFSSTCTREMCAFRDDLQAFVGLGARVVGISVDLPWSLRAFAEHLSLTFPLLSDYNREAVRAFGLEDPTFARGLLPGVARRAVVVLDGDGTVAYRWVAEVPGTEPPYDEVREAVRGLVSRKAG